MGRGCLLPRSAPGGLVERVWWDGDQALVEDRTADGVSDVSNSGVVRNIHGLTLNEPIALIATGDTRIINYNWRGQGMSSVFLDGQAGVREVRFTTTPVHRYSIRASQAVTIVIPGILLKSSSKVATNPGECSLATQTIAVSAKLRL